jgi:hypothetical protein
MDPNYRAADDHWAIIERDFHYSLPACLLELRARVEALEAAQQPAAQKHRAAARRAIESCMAQREEILTAFVAKYGFQPEEAIQVEQRQLDGCSYWWVERRSEVIQDDTEPAPTVKDSLTAAPPAPPGELVERVHSCIVGEPECGHMQARAVLREVASWLRSQPWIGRAAADRLEQEAER